MNDDSNPVDVSRRTVLRAGAAGVGTLSVVGSAAGDGDEREGEWWTDEVGDLEAFYSSTFVEHAIEAGVA